MKQSLSLLLLLALVALVSLSFQPQLVYGQDDAIEALLRELGGSAPTTHNEQDHGAGESGAELEKLLMQVLGNGMGNGGQKESCTFRCPGGTTPRVNPNHTPSSNGCGVPGMEIKPSFAFDDCCHSHDVCYDTCGKDRDVCDSNFERCMMDFCEVVKGKEDCKSEAITFASMTKLFGCSPYMKSQQNACLCDEKDEL